jgi:seryl-tRNA(Sec) selenium transferase
MADPDVPPELAALHAAIAEFVRERRAWPSERHEQAQRDIAEVQALLERAAVELGVKLITTGTANRLDKPSLQ